MDEGMGMTYRVIGGLMGVAAIFLAINGHYEIAAFGMAYGFLLVLVDIAETLKGRR